MRRYTQVGLAMLAVGALALATTPPALARDESDSATVDPVSYCHQVTAGPIIQKVCVKAGTRKVVDAGLDLYPTVTVAAYVEVWCPSPSAVSCDPISPGVNTTGWETNRGAPGPILTPGGVYMPGGNQGTLWISGTPVPIDTPPLCSGDESYCPGI